MIKDVFKKKDVFKQVKIDWASEHLEVAQILGEYLGDLCDNLGSVLIF